MPYFYESGLYLSRPIAPGSSTKGLYSQPSGVYDSSSETPTFWKPQTVEQVIRKGYLAVPKTEPETAPLTDKQHTFWQGLDDIIRQVRSRYEIYDRHINSIERGKCYAISTLYEVQAYRGGVPADGKERYRLTKQLQELYQLEREERTSLWQDVSKLKQQLPETAQQYLSAHRKVSILNEEKGDWL